MSTPLLTPPDGYMKNGTPIYFNIARGNAKSRLTIEVYRKLIDVPDDVWEEIKREVEERLYGNCEETA
jgi:hypothetical protein